MNDTSAFTEETVHVRGHAVRLRHHGQGASVLYLHSEADPVWTSFQSLLATQFRVLAPDPPGFGDTLLPEWIRDIDDLAFFYLDILDALELDTVALVGASMGGWLAAEIAVRAPERFSALVLIGAAGLYLHETPPVDIFFMNTEELQAALYLDPRKEPQRDVDRQIRSQTMTARLAWNPRFYNPKLPQRLHRVAAPTLVLWGRQDAFLSPAYGEHYRHHLRNAQWKTIDQSGHFPTLEQPESTAEYALTFLHSPRLS